MTGSDNQPDLVGTSWRRPADGLWKVRVTETVLVTVVVAVVVILAESSKGDGAETLGASLGVVVGLAVLSGLLLVRRARSWSYGERDDDLVVRRGVMFRRLSVIPYGRMQFIELTAGPLERSFGLATVRMHTAAAASDARIPGLREDEAARLRDQLTALGEARAAGL